MAYQYTLITGLSGALFGSFATAASVATSGQQAWTAANTNAVILSGNATQTGVALITRINSVGSTISGNLTSTGAQLAATAAATYATIANLALTGQQSWTAANTNSVILSGNATQTGVALAATAAATYATIVNLTTTGATLFARDSSISGGLQAQIPLAANPTARLGLAAINGTASTFMRSDASPALDQGIVPTWSGSHTFLSSGVFKITGLGSTGSDAILLTNNTTATGNVLQYSPRIRFNTRAYKSNSPGASQSVNFINELRPVEGTTVSSANLAWASAINAETGYSDILLLKSNGDCRLPIPGSTLLIGSGDGVGFGGSSSTVSLGASALTTRYLGNQGGISQGITFTYDPTTLSAGISAYGDNASQFSLVFGNSSAGDTSSFSMSDAGIVNITSNGNGSIILQANQAGSVSISSSNLAAIINGGAGVDLKYDDTNVIRITGSTSAGIVFSQYGAGTLTTDANGIVTASSDARLKNVQGPFTGGLESVLSLRPVVYRWNERSTLDQNNVYAGFLAQDVKSVIPCAVGVAKDGYLTLNDRAIICALVKAVQELAEQNATLSSSMSGLLSRC